MDNTKVHPSALMDKNKKTLKSVHQSRKDSKISPTIKVKEERYLKKLSMISEQEEKWWEVRFLFHPESGARMIWDILILAFIIYQSLSVPYFICFNDIPSDLTNGFEFLMNICFISDVLATFNTGFYIKGTLVMNRKDIIKDYIKFWFWMDVVASMPYNWFVGNIFGGDSTSSAYNAPKVLRLMRIFRFLKVLRLLRLAKLKKILMKIEDYIASNTLANIFVFGKLLALVFFIAHWTACLWFFIGDQGSDIHPVTWITYINLQNSSIFEKYITSLYWAFTTMSTVGYGDITPFTVTEKIFAMMTMIMASGVFAFTIGSIGALVSKANSVENAYREQAVAVNRYMKRKYLPNNLQFRVRRYLDYVWENKKKNKMDERQVLILLSEPLRDEIYSHIHGVVIKFCKIFEKFETNFISQLARTLINETFAPGDNIIEEGEMSDKMYFIMMGKVIIYHGLTKSMIQELGEKQYFGEISFFTSNPRCASVKCTDFVDVLSLTRLNFNCLVSKFPEASEIIEGLIRNCEKGDFSCLNISCYLCEEVGHYAIKCKLLMINLDQEETRNKWMHERNDQSSKLVNNKDVQTPRFNRKIKKIKLCPRYNGRNVVGIPRENMMLTQAYPEISETPEPVVIESSTGDSIDCVQNVTIRPIYSELYLNSEESISPRGDAEGKNPRKAVFRLSLIKKKLLYDQASSVRIKKPLSRTSIIH